MISLFKDYGVDLILHGHLHTTHHYEKKGLNFLNAGGSVKSPDSNKLKFNIINVSKDSITSDIKKISIENNNKEEKIFAIPDRNPLILNSKGELVEN